eukprot:9835116-Alexandrium_andersonii.AAC.1
MAQIRQLHLEGAANEDTIVALTELLAYLVLTVARAAGWSGELVIYVTDMMVVKGWLLRRRARH